MAKRIVDVLVPVALDHAYSYRVPEDLALAPGDLVRVPLGVRECTAVVWAENENPNPRLDNRLKDIEAKLDIPPLKPELRKFVEWVSGYTLSPRGMVLRMALRMGEQLGPERVRIGVRMAGPPPARMTAARARVLKALADGLVRAKGDAAREAGVSVGVIDGLVDEGTLEAVPMPPEAPARPPDPAYAVPDFSAVQETRRRRAARARAGRRLLRDPARRRHRLRQDRGLFRGGGGSDRAGAPEPHPDAGNRADRPVARPLRGAVRRASGGMAFGAEPARTRAHLAGRRRGRGQRRRRGALGAVSALCRSRPRHRRRGA